MRNGIKFTESNFEALIQKYQQKAIIPHISVIKVRPHGEHLVFLRGSTTFFKIYY